MPSKVIKLEQMALAKQDNFPVQIFVHHTGGTDSDPLADTSHHGFTVIQSGHISKGWENIGYHYVIEKSGKVVAGRPVTYHSAAVVGHNNDSISICLSGNFDATLPTEAQTEELAKLLHELCLKYNIPAKNIYPHRHAANKTCYGRKLSDTWASDLAMNYKFTAEVPEPVKPIPAPETPITAPATPTHIEEELPPIGTGNAPVIEDKEVPEKDTRQGLIIAILMAIARLIISMFKKKDKSA